MSKLLGFFFILKLHACNSIFKSGHNFKSCFTKCITTVQKSFYWGWFKYQVKFLKRDSIWFHFESIQHWKQQNKFDKTILFPVWKKSIKKHPRNILFGHLNLNLLGSKFVYLEKIIKNMFDIYHNKRWIHHFNSI